jgi:hypothetical protein
MPGLQLLSCKTLQADSESEAVSASNNLGSLKFATSEWGKPTNWNVRVLKTYIFSEFPARVAFL